MRKRRPRQVEIDRDRIARDAGLGPGQQPLLAEQAVDQRGFAGIGPSDDRDANGLFFPDVASSASLVVVTLAAVASGSAARSAS